MLIIIPESFIEQLKYSCSIENIISEYVTLKRGGRNIVGLCPFHSEKSPSFTVYPDNQSYYCFGCGKGGDVVTFIITIENLDYIESLRFLANKVGIPFPENTTEDTGAKTKIKVLEINRLTARFYYDMLLSSEGEKAREYLNGRELTAKTIKKFGIGYSPAAWDKLREYLLNKGYSQEELLQAGVVTKGKTGSCYDSFRGRVMFPIIDLRGNVIAFGGRAMEDKGPKYINSSDTVVFKKSRNLFALNFAKNAKQDTLILGEGYMDVIAMNQAGFENAVATLGTSLTQEQARLISQYCSKVVIAYDSDSAGQNATKRAINLFSQTNVLVNVLEMQGAKDPDEYIKKYGAQRFEILINSGKSAVNFEIDKLKNQFDLENTQDKVNFLNAFCILMADIQSNIVRDVYISEVAKELDVGKERLNSTTEAIRKKKYSANAKKETHNLRTYAQDKAEMANFTGQSEMLNGFVAEQKIIQLLMKHPDFYSEIENIVTAQDFANETHRAIYTNIECLLKENTSPSIINISAHLTSEQVSKLSGLMAASRDIQFIRQQAEEYSRAIVAQKGNKSKKEIGSMTDEEFLEYTNASGAKKK